MVKGMAAEDLAPQSSRFSMKKIEKMMPGTRRAVISTFSFQRRPPITGEGERGGGGEEGGKGERKREKREGGGEGGGERGRERGGRGERGRKS